jgi:hydrogenase maturation protease
MNLGLVEKIADAVLYEGYILYPYRPSAVKNQQRWNFGALCPEAYSRAQGGTEAWTMQTECLATGGGATALDLKVRFLHLSEREVCIPIADCGLRIADLKDDEIQASIDDSELQVVPSLEAGGRLFQTWQESVERNVSLSSLNLNEVVDQPRRLAFSFPESREVEPLRDEASGQLVGVIVRRRQAIEGAIEVRVEGLAASASEIDNPQSAIRNPRCFKMNVRILNLTPLEDADGRSRDEALMRSFVSTHTILSVREGEFVSLLDPPEGYKETAAGCRNVGTYPVLVGEEGERGVMLSSPIILYDYPQIAPESAGELFDGTEIDEILTLRIMTMTDEEKREMRGVDERARRILERTEQLPAEQLMKMHGAIKKVPGSKFQVPSSSTDSDFEL